MTTRKIRPPVNIFVLLVVSLAAPFASAGPEQQMIVLGFDGVDAKLTEQWMDQGELPNLARLRESGSFRHLTPTTPAQTPVSWSTFSTGINPGRTGIFDFLRRDPQTYYPIFAAMDEGERTLLAGDRNPLLAGGVAALLAFGVGFLVLRSLGIRSPVSAIVALIVAILAGIGVRTWAKDNVPSTIPTVTNRQQGIPMWEALAEAGFESKVVHVPVTFPARDFAGGELLSGLGVPDVSARVGKPFFFTSELDFNRDRSNEFSIEVVQLEDNRGVIETEIVGPPNKLFDEPAYISTPMTIRVADDRESIDLTVGERTHTLRPGEWTDWVEFEFPFTSLVNVNGISRFHLFSVKPEVKLYLSPINFDPRSLPPGFRISTPEGWAGQLAEQYGPYKTIGWQIDTWAISEGFADEQVFWDDLEWTVEQYRTMYRDFLAAGDDDLFIQCFEFPDRVAHVFYRFHDPEHPGYDPELAAVWGGAILRAYKIMDEIVGEAMQAAAAHDARLIVLSDHGFSTWRRSINYNTWLAENGYLALDSGVEVGERNLEILFDHGEFWENVDWSRTKAYALGLGDIYVNLAGRERDGIVQPGEEYDSLRREIRKGLESLVDDATGERPVHRVYMREEVYSAFDPNLIPDMIAANSEGYRVSWQTSLGGVQKEIFSVNDAVWSGDHCSLEPTLVKGIFFSNERLPDGVEPYIADIYATVLDHFEVAPPYELDGAALPLSRGTELSARR